MPDAGRQIWEKNGVPKAFKLTLSRNMSKQKQSENVGKGTQKKCRRKMNWKETQKKWVEMKMKKNKEGRPK